MITHTHKSTYLQYVFSICTLSGNLSLFLPDRMSELPVSSNSVWLHCGDGRKGRSFVVGLFASTATKRMKKKKRRKRKHITCRCCLSMTSTSRRRN